MGENGVTGVDEGEGVKGVLDASKMESKMRGKMLKTETLKC
jgi:hypothetical protein